jgi:ethanolamine utilization microcompartment shell protein EutS
LVIGDSYAADKIALNCSGTLSGTVETPIPSLSLLIDLNLFRVTGSIGPFFISKITENRVDFKAVRNGDIVLGTVDRYSGSAVITTRRNEEMVSTYNLTCKSANPLF